MDDKLFNASICGGVVLGHFVILGDTDDGEQEIVYAGPIKTAPITAGKLVLLCAVDFEKLTGTVDRNRH